MFESDEFLIACMGYCLSWEVGGARASQYWSGLREYVQQHEELTETERWCSELYEESGPTAQEERSIISRINSRIDHPRRAVNFRQSILALLPEPLEAAAAKHRLMNSLALPEGYGRLRAWLAEHKLARLGSGPVELPPLSTREADFQVFIENPYFIEGFRKFWKQAPKYRDNKETRVLLCVAAALSQMVICDDAAELKEWSHRLGRIGSYTEQTRDDVAELSLAMLDASYDAQELGYRLFVDAKEADRKALLNFYKRYDDQMTGFAHDLVRSMEIAI